MPSHHGTLWKDLERLKNAFRLWNTMDRFGAVEKCFRPSRRRELGRRQPNRTVCNVLKCICRPWAPPAERDPSAARRASQRSRANLSARPLRQHRAAPGSGDPLGWILRIVTARYVWTARLCPACRGSGALASTSLGSQPTRTPSFPESRPPAREHRPTTRTSSDRAVRCWPGTRPTSATCPCRRPSGP